VILRGFYVNREGDKTAVFLMATKRRRRRNESGLSKQRGDKKYKTTLFYFLKYLESDLETFLRNIFIQGD
jgi:hypothetical protein